MNKKVVHVSGKRKQAIARATVKPGTGMVRVNHTALNVFEPKMARMRMMEPLIIAGELAEKVNIDVNIHGGGIISGTDAARLAIARGLVEFYGKETLRKQFIDYDRTLLVADVRRKEPCKPNDSKARAKRQKSYR